MHSEAACGRNEEGRLAKRVGPGWVVNWSVEFEWSCEGLRYFKLEVVCFHCFLFVTDTYTESTVVQSIRVKSINDCTARLKL